MVYIILGDGALTMGLGLFNGLKDLVGVFDFSGRGAEDLVDHFHMPGRNGGFAGEAQSFGVLGILYDAFVIVNIRKGSVVHIHAGGPGGNDQTGPGVLDLPALLGALALQIGGQIFRAQEQGLYAL